MSAKQQAIRDIKEFLKKESKCFLAFRTELNPVMAYLVNSQIKAQMHKNRKRKKFINSKINSQKVASCFFIAANRADYTDYSQYYN